MKGHHSTHVVIDEVHEMPAAAYASWNTLNPRQIWDDLRKASELVAYEPMRPVAARSQIERWLRWAEQEGPEAARLMTELLGGWHIVEPQLIELSTADMEIPPAEWRPPSAPLLGPCMLGPCKVGRRR